MKKLARLTALLLTGALLLVLTACGGAPGGGASMTPEEIEALLDPKLYVGRCPEQVDRFLKEIEPLIGDVKRETAEINL